MNNLRKFNSEAEYSAATLNYPSVAWVTGSDTVHFDKTAPVVVNDKVMIAFTSGNDGDFDIRLYNGEISIVPSASDYFTSITLNDTDVRSAAISHNGLLDNVGEANTDYLIKYGISTTTVEDYFASNIGDADTSSGNNLDVLIPSQVTAIDRVPNEGTKKLVVEATTPPTLSFQSSDLQDLQGIYVPTDSVNAYKSAWTEFADYIHPISDYSGNLPV